MEGAKERQKGGAGAGEFVMGCRGRPDRGGCVVSACVGVTGMTGMMGMGVRGDVGKGPKERRREEEDGEIAR